MEPLRFCMLTTFYPPFAFGGDGEFVYRLSNLLARLGHEVEVIHCVDSYRALAKGDAPPGYVNAPGVTVHRLSSRAGILSPLATQQTGHPFFKGRKIRRILASKRFDVLHFHNISLLGGPGILRYGQGIKLYTLHEHWLICPTHVLFKFKREPCVKRSCLRCTLVYRRPPQLWRYTRILERALRHVDAFISPSEFTLRRHEAEGLDIPLIHIPHFVSEATKESNVQLSSTASAALRQPFFLFAGRLEQLKGLQTVIPLFRVYDQAHLVIAGDGDYAPELRAAASGCSRVHFVGRLPREELAVLYRRAIALLVPSVTFESFGQVVIEAFQNRTPVIVRNLGALPEMVAESGGGLTFREEADLLHAMERLQRDKSFRDELGERGYDAYRAHWTEEAHLERYLGLIEEIRRRKTEQGKKPLPTLGA